MHDTMKSTSGHNFYGQMSKKDFKEYVIKNGIPGFVVFDDYDGVVWMIGCCDTYCQCLKIMQQWELDTDGECHTFTAWYDDETRQYRRD